MHLRVFILFILVLGGCQTAPDNACRLWYENPEAEALAGRRAAPMLELRCGGVVHDPKIDPVLLRANRRLAAVSPALPPCSSALLATAETNAYSLPGYIYITRGLYERLGGREELIAAVIAHEMGHIEHKDSLRSQGVSSGEALEREVDADLAAARRLQDAGYSPEAALRVLALIRDVQPEGWAPVREQRLDAALHPVTMAGGAAKR